MIPEPYFSKHDKKHVKDLLETYGVKSVGKYLKTVDEWTARKALYAVEHCGAEEAVLIDGSLSPMDIDRAIAAKAGSDSPQPMPQPENNGALEDLRSAFERLGVVGNAPAAMDEDRVLELIAEAIESVPPTRIEIDNTVRPLPAVRHEKFEEVLSLAVRGSRNVALVGPAGSGKTYMAEQLGAALDLPVLVISGSEGVTESTFQGRLLPNSEGVFEFSDTSGFVNAYTSGAVILVDEADQMDANAFGSLNAATANGFIPLPLHPTVDQAKRHPDTVFMLAMNTFGMGPDRQYVGRNQLDAASLDRFAGRVVEMDYSPTVERAIAKSFGDNGTSAARFVWRLRHNVRTSRLRRVVSTRILCEYAEALAVGDGPACLRRFFSGWKEDELAKVGHDGLGGDEPNWQTMEV